MNCGYCTGFCYFFNIISTQPHGANSHTVIHQLLAPKPWLQTVINVYYRHGKTINNINAAEGVTTFPQDKETFSNKRRNARSESKQAKKEVIQNTPPSN